MLLIPDIHINSQYRDSILQTLSDIVIDHPQEDHIVLLGDYVYMFSYDRDALLGLYKLMIWRYHVGKTVYVLAWNHDWHGQHFVYEEAKQAWDIISSDRPLLAGEGLGVREGKIYFITTPQVFDIEWESVLMIPYMIDWSIYQSNKIPASPLSRGGGWKPEGFRERCKSNELTNNNSVEDVDNNIAELNAPCLHTNAPLRQALTQSTNKYEQASGRLNLALAHYTEQYQIDTIIHHYYTADIQFPWLRTQFGYRDVALDPCWTNAGYDVISGHIHHPLVYGRYLWCGSLRTTAANETNQFKYYRIKHKSDLRGYQIQINPHVTLTHDGSPLSIDHLQSHRDTLTQQYIQELQSDHYHITLHHTPLQTHLTSIAILTDQHTDLTQISDQTMIDQVKSVKPKYKTTINNDHTLLNIDTEQLKTSVIQRQSMLVEYLASKYTDQQTIYLDLLDELQIIDKK